MDGTTDKQDLGDICVGGSLEMTDEELAKRLQVEEEEEYQNFLKARKTQCDLDYKLASVLADDSVLSSYSADLFDISESKSTGSSPCASSVNAKIRSHAKDSSKANSVIIISDDELDVTKDFEELERAVEQQTEEADEHFSAAAAAEEDREGSELTELLENDDYLDRLIADDNDMADIGSDSFFSTASSSLSTTSSSSGHMTPILNEDDRSNENGSSVDPDRSEYQTDNRFTDAPRTEENEGVMISTLNSAWNVIGSAINLLSDLLSPRPTPSAGERGEDVACEFLSEELGYEADEDYDDDDYDEDDEGERDEENEFDDMSEGHGSGSEFTLHFDEDSMDQGLCPEEIEILPTRTYRPLNKQHSNPSQNLVEDSELMECQVCLNEFTEGELLRMLPCCHQFHAKCIDVWLRRDDICPVCRLRVGAELFAA